MSQGNIVASNTRNSLSVIWENGWEEKEFDVDVVYSYYFNRFLNAFCGGNFTDEENQGIAGIRYLLPLLFESETRIDTEGDLRFTLEKDLQLSDHLNSFGEAQYDTEDKWEWATGLKWTFTKYFSAMGQYHSEYGAGAGILIEY